MNVESTEIPYRNGIFISFVPRWWKNYVCCVTCSICVIFLRPDPAAWVLDSCPSHAHYHVMQYSPSTSHILWYNTYWTNYRTLRKRCRRGGYNVASANFWFNLLPFWGNVNTLLHTFQNFSSVTVCSHIYFSIFYTGQLINVLLKKILCFWNIVRIFRIHLVIPFRFDILTLPIHFALWIAVHVYCGMEGIGPVFPVKHGFSYMVLGSL